MQAISINNQAKLMTEQHIHGCVDSPSSTGPHYGSVLRPFRWHSRISLHFRKNLRLNAKPKAHKTPRVCVKRQQKDKAKIYK